MPTLAAHNFKNKCGRPHFLFDCSRTNIFLLGLNKEMLFFALFFYVFDLKVCRKHFLNRKFFMRFFEGNSSLAAHILKSK